MSNGDIISSQKIRIEGISQIKNLKASTTSSRKVVRTILSLIEQYIVQQARRAYLTSISQPKALFDLFYIAQLTKFSLKNIIILNKRLYWQIDNKSYKLKYVKLDQTSLQLIVFINFSFINNSNLLLQIDFIIYFANLAFKANIIY